MKASIAIFFFLILSIAWAAVPTEEGLLKNLNNSNIPGNLITVKAMITNSQIATGQTPGQNLENDKADYFKFIISVEKLDVVSMLQINYANSKMVNSQIKDVKYFPDLLMTIKNEKNQEKNMFYAILMMLTTNRSEGVEAFLEKCGTKIVYNKDVMNEEKLKLLRNYKTYLLQNKGKGEVGSPLNPVDPYTKARVIELFKANTFERSRNIELTKLENQFVWKVDWKTVKAYFSNEERRFLMMEYLNGEMSLKIEALEYVLFNNNNELPKYIWLKDSKDVKNKIQILGLDTKNNKEKKLNERYEELKKNIPINIPSISTTNENISYSFLF